MTISQPSGYGFGTGGDLVLKPAQSQASTYGTDTAFRRTWVSHVLLHGDGTQNDTNSQCVRLQLPASFADSNSTYGRIKIAYLQSHHSGAYSAEFTFHSYYRSGTTNYGTWDFSQYQVNKVQQHRKQAASYVSEAQLDYIEENLDFYTHNPTSGYDGQSNGLVIKLPNTSSLRMQDVVIEVEIMGRSGYEGAIKFEDLGRWGANAPSNLVSIAVTESFVGGRNTNEIHTSSKVGIGTSVPAYALEINGSNSGINIKGGNNRIYFTGARALEGNGTTLQIGEGHSTGLYQMATNTFYGNINPSSDDTHDLGNASTRWRNIYTGDLHLSNEGKEEGNEVDGTTGNWTIQEGEEHLYIINNKSGKKFRFALEEIE